MSKYLMISDAAKEVQVETHVLRYWEEELRLPIKRNEQGHRYYTKEDIRKFKEIKEMKEKGLQLKAIKMILKNGQLEMLSETSEGMEEQENRGRVVGEKEIEMNSESEAVNYGQLPKMELKKNDELESNTMAIDIIETKQEAAIITEKEEKARRLQWMLQQLIRETLQENNYELCQQMKESVIKEMDYQFRMQEEREEAREKVFRERNEAYYKKMDELLRIKQGKKKRHFI